MADALTLVPGPYGPAGLTLIDPIPDGLTDVLSVYVTGTRAKPTLALRLPLIVSVHVLLVEDVPLQFPPQEAMA